MALLPSLSSLFLGTPQVIFCFIESDETEILFLGRRIDIDYYTKFVQTYVYS